MSKRTIRREAVIDCNQRTCGKCAWLSLSAYPNVWCSYFRLLVKKQAYGTGEGYLRLPDCMVAEVKEAK